MEIATPSNSTGTGYAPPVPVALDVTVDIPVIPAWAAEKVSDRFGMCTMLMKFEGSKVKKCRG